MGSKKSENGSMKTTVDIPENELRDARRCTKAETKREAVVRVLEGSTAGYTGSISGTTTPTSNNSSNLTRE